MRKTDLLPEQQKSRSIFKTRFEAIFRWSQKLSRNQPQPLRLVPDPYHLTQSYLPIPSVRDHYFLESSARSDCLLVGDHVASSSLDAPQNYMIVSAFRYSESLENWSDECFKLGGSDDMFAISVDIGSCPSWRQLFIKDNFFEIDFDGCGNIEFFKIEEVEFLSHVLVHLHFKCSKYHHKSFLKWYELVRDAKPDMKRLKDKAARDKLEHEFIAMSQEKYGEFKRLKLTLNSFFFLRPLTVESLGRFCSSFQYLLEICRLFCHIIAKGLLERHDHPTCQGTGSAHSYQDYPNFLTQEGCNQIDKTVSQFLEYADDRRMRLINFMPYGLQFKDDPTYKSCLSVANQVQDTLFFLKETFKILSPPSGSLDPLNLKPNPLTIWLPTPPHPLQSGFNSEEFDLSMSHRHNQRFMQRSIHRAATKTSNHDVFDSFETFVDPFFASSRIQNAGNLRDPRDLRRLFYNMTRSVHSLDMGQVFSFSTGLSNIFARLALL